MDGMDGMDEMDEMLSVVVRSELSMLQCLRLSSEIFNVRNNGLSMDWCFIRGTDVYIIGHFLDLVGKEGPQPLEPPPNSHNSI